MLAVTLTGEGDSITKALAEPRIVGLAHRVPRRRAAVHIDADLFEAQLLDVREKRDFRAFGFLCAGGVVFDNDSAGVAFGWKDDGGGEEAHLGVLGDVHVGEFGAFEEHEAAVVLEALVGGDEGVEAGAPKGLDGVGVELLDLHSGIMRRTGLGREGVEHHKVVRYQTEAVEQGKSRMTRCSIKQARTVQRRTRGFKDRIVIGISWGTVDLPLILTFDAQLQRVKSVVLQTPIRGMLPRQLVRFLPQSYG